MIEAITLLLLIALLVGTGCWLWKAARGTAKSKTALIGRLALLFLVFSIPVLWAMWTISKSRSFQFFGQLVPRGQTIQPVVALTFDDGPKPEATDKILAVLREKNVKATFFLTGAELSEYPAGGSKIFGEGHEIGNHSFSHDRMFFKSWSFIRSELERTDNLIRQTGWQGTIHFRTPFGKRFLLLPLYLRQHNRQNILWDIEPDSYPEIASSSERIAQHVISNAQPGSIILLHVMYPHRATSMNAVPLIVDGLRQKGYSFKTVSEMLALDHKTTDHR